ncbi:MAG: hypothetical protein ACJ719_02730 [Nitrososphaeraceae archaeon]
MQKNQMYRTHPNEWDFHGFDNADNYGNDFVDSSSNNGHGMARTRTTT